MITRARTVSFSHQPDLSQIVLICIHMHDIHNHKLREVVPHLDVFKILHSRHRYAQLAINPGRTQSLSRHCPW